MDFKLNFIWNYIAYNPDIKPIDYYQKWEMIKQVRFSKYISYIPYKK